MATGRAQPAELEAASSVTTEAIELVTLGFVSDGSRYYVLLRPIELLLSNVPCGRSRWKGTRTCATPESIRVMLR